MKRVFNIAVSFCCKNITNRPSLSHFLETKGDHMFSKIPPFFSMPNMSPAELEAAPSFAGMPLVNPLLNDAQANIDTIDERIQQLESVAQWLNLNLQMVNSSVQQLQVQKQTLLALAQWQELSKSTMESFSKNM